MPRFNEYIGRDIGPWRAAVQDQLTPDYEACAVRLDELQQAAADQGWRAWFGHEIEYVLESPDQRGAQPDKEEFYTALIRALCHGELPPAVKKGEVIDPFAYPAPVIMNFWDGTYNPDQPNSPISEIRTAPAEWRQAEYRYWHTLSTIGSLAACRGLRVKIVGTHMSNVFTQGDPENEYAATENFLGDGRALLAAQRARRYLQPFEQYAGLISGHESFASKAARWALYGARVETRYPIFGIVDPRPSMLGALGGLNQMLRKELPPDEWQSLHHGFKVNIFSLQDAVHALNEFLFWDVRTKRIVLPERMTGRNVRAAVGQAMTLKMNEFITYMTDGVVTNFDQNGAVALRDVVDDLSLRGGVPKANRHKERWRRYLTSSEVDLIPAVRIVADSPYQPATSPIHLREQASRSPEVATLLGRRLFSSLTHPKRAHHMRQTILGGRW